jgi:hypothetical protein
LWWISGLRAKCCIKAQERGAAARGPSVARKQAAPLKLDADQRQAGAMRHICRRIGQGKENCQKSIAWEKDNVGLQIGSLRREVKNILLCLDVDEKVVDEASRKKCNLIISHHPLLFRSLKYSFLLRLDNVFGSEWSCTLIRKVAGYESSELFLPWEFNTGESII